MFKKSIGKFVTTCQLTLQEDEELKQTKNFDSEVFATPPSKNSSGIIVAFNQSTGDLITGDKQRDAVFDRFIDKNYLGAKQWMLKWNN